MLRKLLLLLSLFICIPSFGSAKDSLLNAYNTAKGAGEKASILIEIAKQQSAVNPDTASSYLYRAERLAEAAGESAVQATALYEHGYLYFQMGYYEKARPFWKKALPLMENEKLEDLPALYNGLGFISKHEGSNNEALSFHKRALRVFRASKDTSNIAVTLRNLGLVEMNTGDQEAAMKHFLEAISLLENTRFRRELGFTFITIGNVLLAQKDYNQANKYYQEALEVFLKTGDKVGTAGSYISIGNVYYYKHDYTKALDYYQKTLDLRRQINDRNGIASIYTNIGEIQLKMQNVDSARIYFLKSLSIFRELGSAMGEAGALMHLGEAERQNSNLQMAEAHLKEALAIADKINYKQWIRDIHLALAKVYAGKGDFEKAFVHQEKYSQVNDSVLNEQSMQAVQELEKKYESQKKQSQIELLEKEKEKDRITIYAFSAGFILLFLLSMISLNAYRRKRRDGLLLARQNSLIQEKNKDIMDSISFARRIQDAMQPSLESLKSIFPENFILYLPRDVVSGDFYWTTLKGDHAFFAVADCMGHGVPGALLSMIGLNRLNFIIGEKGITSPALILEQLHQLIAMDLGQERSQKDAKGGMDIGLISFNRKSGEITFSGAVRPLLLCSETGYEIYKGDRISIAGMKEPGQLFSEQKFIPAKGSMLFMFSDGFADQFGGPSNKKFMSRKFHDLLCMISGKPVEEQKELLELEFNRWKQQADQVDDVLVAGIRF